MSSHTISTLVSQRTFFGTAALLFVVSTAVTIVWCASMSSMCGMPMPGGWTMSMPWMRMPGQSWFDATLSFVGMWSVMMIAMMLPALVPMLWRYRQRLGIGAGARLEWLSAVAGSGYFFVWIVVGIGVFALGAALMQSATQLPALARAMPTMAGLVVLIAGLLQFSTWKTHQLACCRQLPHCDDVLQERLLSADAGAAWKYGLRLGLHCCYCCAGPTAVLLVIGVMDLQAMAIVAIAIAAERLAPSCLNVARGIGIIAIAAAVPMLARANGVG